MRRFAIVVLLAIVGSMGGSLLAGVSLPHGPLDHTAFAELTHNGGTPAAGTIHLALDCDPSMPGTQDSCLALPWITTDLDIDVTAGNATGTARTIRRFSFAVTVDQAVLDPNAGIDANKDANPDANDVLVDATWSCTPPAPDRDTDLDPAVARSFIECSTAGPGIVLYPDPAPHLALATVHYTVTSAPGFWASAVMMSDVKVYDGTGAEIMSCNPPNAGPCFGAAVSVAPPPTDATITAPTATPTPTPLSVVAVGGIARQPGVLPQPAARSSSRAAEGVAAAIAVAAALTLAAACGSWLRRRARTGA